MSDAEGHGGETDGFLEGDNGSPSTTIKTLGNYSESSSSSSLGNLKNNGNQHNNSSKVQLAQNAGSTSISTINNNTNTDSSANPVNGTGATSTNNNNTAASASTTRRRSSVLSLTSVPRSLSQEFEKEVILDQAPPMRQRNHSVSSLSPVASPVMYTKSYPSQLQRASSSSAGSMDPTPTKGAFSIDMVKHSSDGIPLYVSTAASRSASIASRRSRKNRLFTFGVLITALSSLLWFSVYNRHASLGLSDDEETTIKRGPWLILALVLFLLGLAALAAGLQLKREEDRLKLRILRGDAELGILAEHDESMETSYTEPTTPQKIWAQKALSELDRL